MKFKNDIEKFEFFEAILNDNVTVSEIKEFEDALTRDNNLSEEFNEYKNLHEIVIDDSVLGIKDTLKTIHSKTINHSGRGKGFSNTGIVISIVTGAIIVSSLFFLLKPSDNEEQTEETLTRIETPNDFKENEEQVKVNKEPEQVKSGLEKDNQKEREESQLSPEKVVLENDSEQEQKENPKFTQVNEEMKEMAVLPKQISDNQLPEQTLVVSDKKEDNTSVLPEEAIDCNKVNITCDYSFANSCIEEVSGKIQILKSSLKGGTEPYLISINGGRDFYESKFMFSYLRAGEYSLIIRDKNLCEKQIADIQIEEKICETEYKYSPILGDPWLIPFEKEKSGVFRLFSKTGQVLIEKEIDSYSDKTWYGKDDHDNSLEMGYYPFVIQYSDGEIFQGSVTLFK